MTKRQQFQRRKCGPRTLKGRTCVTLLLRSVDSIISWVSLRTKGTSSQTSLRLSWCSLTASMKTGTLGSGRRATLRLSRWRTKPNFRGARHASKIYQQMRFTVNCATLLAKDLMNSSLIVQPIKSTSHLKLSLLLLVMTLYFPNLQGQILLTSEWSHEDLKIEISLTQAIV